ncbi:MFS transporter [Azohydromonas aeria]|uniref:MFS transporter n=1 Tax=Azohydromonas aeria TaxID=2590212 RepID=UPI0012F82C43|nr:MFS transporter [Azohydromonas aeria]
MSLAVPLLQRLASPAVGMVLIAANLRPALMGVGPLLKQIQADTGLSPSTLGWLITMPVIAFGAVSPLAAPLARRFGLERTLLAAMLALAAGIALRSLPGTACLFAGAALLGAAIAIGNVLVPALVRRDFPARIGPMTSLFVTTLAGVAAVGAGLAVPMAGWLGWRLALAAWALPASVAAAWWLLAPGRGVQPSAATAPPPPAPRPGGLWRSALAWQVSLFMGLQSLAFYVLVAWLPSLLQDAGLSAATAGSYAFLYQVACLSGSLVAPLLAARAREQRWHAFAASALSLLGFVGLAGTAPSVIWVLIGGLGSGASLALCLAFFSLRTSHPSQTASLSGMAQAVGYSLAALGPVGFGWLHDTSGNWHAPLVAMWVLIALQCAIGLQAGRARRI